MPKTPRNQRMKKGTLISHGSAILAMFLIVLELEPALGQSKFDVDTPGFQVEATIGWGGMADRSVPIPLAFHFRNDTDHNIAGRLIVSDKTSGYQIDLGDVIVSPASTRRLTSIQKMTDWYDAVATLYAGGKIVWRRDLALLTGNMFDSNLSYLLFIDEGGRRFQIPGDLSPEVNTNRSNGQHVPAGTNGRSVRCVTVKPWQLSNHPGPLIVAQAMIFAEGTTERDLNQVQWKSVAEWMCQGGTVFLPATSREAIERLISSSPLGADQEHRSGTLAVRRSGLGSLYEYSGPLMTSEGESLRIEIAEIVATLSKNQINRFGDSRFFQHHGRSNTESKRNSLLIVGLFSAYTLLSGLVTMMLFRLSQKRVAIYITTVVIGTSFCAILLGGYLQMSKGDLRWVTLTQAGSGGLVQVGALEVQSAGGRNALITIIGDNVDLQFIGKPSTLYNYWMPQAYGYAPFTWQPNLDQTDKNTFQIRVAMSPWGRRRCHATAFQREPQRLEVEMQFEPSQQSDQLSESKTTEIDKLKGRFKVEIENRLPFDLEHCWLVIGTSEEDVSNNQNPNRSRTIRNRQNQGYYHEAIDGLIDIYHLEEIGSLDSQVPRHIEFDSKFDLQGQHNWNMMKNWPYGSQIPPRLSQIGRNQAWIIGELHDSPIIKIDEERTDFIPAERNSHLFVQEIPFEDLPRSLVPVSRRVDAKPEIDSEELPVSAEQPSNN